MRNSQPGGDTEVHRVDQTHVTNTDTEFTDLTVSAGGRRFFITGTQNHPYYDLTQHAFADARDLAVGERLQTSDAEVATVASVHDYTGSLTTYDLTIDGTHTYFVAAGQTTVLVHNVDPCKVYPNKYPKTLAAELAIAEQLGVKVTTPGTAAFDEAIATGRVKWAVLEDGRLVVMPKWVHGQEISHAVLSGGQPVRAAGEAEIIGSNGNYFGAEIDGQSGHFFEKDWDAREIGLDFFAQAGINFP